MSENLSFTQELRKLGLIAGSNNQVTTNNTNTLTNDTNDNKSETNNDDIKIERTNFNDSLMYIGRKPAMNYVLAINTRMLEGLDKITLKSRGKTISKAVDVAEIVTNRFITDANDDEVRLSTEEIFRDDGTSTNVSTIEIVIKRN